MHLLDMHGNHPDKLRCGTVDLPGHCRSVQGAVVVGGGPVQQNVHISVRERVYVLCNNSGGAAVWLCSAFVLRA